MAASVLPEQLPHPFHDHGQLQVLWIPLSGAEGASPRMDSEAAFSGYLPTKTEQPCDLALTMAKHSSKPHPASPP